MNVEELKKKLENYADDIPVYAENVIKTEEYPYYQQTLYDIKGGRCEIKSKEDVNLYLAIKKCEDNTEEKTDNKPITSVIVTFSRVYEVPIEQIYDRLDLNIDNIEEEDIKEEAKLMATDWLNDEIGLYDTEDFASAEVTVMRN